MQITPTTGSKRSNKSSHFPTVVIPVSFEETQSVLLFTEMYHTCEKNNLFWVAREQEDVIASVKRQTCRMLVLLHVGPRRMQSLAGGISVGIAQTALTGTAFKVLHFCRVTTEAIFSLTDR